MIRFPFALLFLLCLWPPLAAQGWVLRSYPSQVVPTTRNTRSRPDKVRLNLSSLSWSNPASWFSNTEEDSIAFESPSSQTSVSDDKAAILQVGAALDRGQAYNPTSGSYYAERLTIPKDMIEKFLQTNHDQIPQSIDDIMGEYELILTTYPKGIYRSSPTFLAVQESLRYDHAHGKDKIFGWVPFVDNNMTKTELFFRAHEFQAKFLKTNKVGRVAHYFTNTTLYSEFDTALLNLQAIIPFGRWFKFLPEVGGSLVTASHLRLDHDSDNHQAVLDLQVDYSTPRKVKGIWGKGKFDWRIPVGDIWQQMPWNQGRPPAFRLFVRYADGDFQILQDATGEYFVYTKPVMPRPLDLVDCEEEN